MTGWLLVHFLIGATGTWLARRYALHRNLLDQPGARRSHVQPTPRGGGIAIVSALLAAAVWLGFGSEGWTPLLLGFLAGLLLVAGIGLLDDHQPLSPWLRIGVHGLAALLLAIGIWMTTTSIVLAGAAFSLALALTNVWNFMDGIDGLAATQAALVAASVALASSGAWQWLALALLAATCGFLPFNVPKARIFLGDVGSGALGFALAALVIVAIAQAPQRWPLWSLPLSAFLLDAGLTLFGRLRRGEAWWQPHALHTYQAWARRSGGHVGVALAYAMWTLLGLGLQLGLADASVAVMLSSCLLWYIAGTGIWWLLQRKQSRGVAMENME